MPLFRTICSLNFRDPIVLPKHPNTSKREKACRRIKRRSYLLTSFRTPPAFYSNSRLVFSHSLPSYAKELLQFGSGDGEQHEHMNPNGATYFAELFCLLGPTIPRARAPETSACNETFIYFWLESASSRCGSMYLFSLFSYFSVPAKHIEYFTSSFPPPLPNRNTAKSFPVHGRCTDCLSLSPWTWACFLSFASCQLLSKKNTE